MRTINYFTISLLMGFLTLQTSCTSKKSNTTTDKQTEAKHTVQVKTMNVKQELITRYIDFTVSLNPFEEVHLAPSSPGRIEKINVEIGNNVQKGQVVALMDRTNMEQARINLMKLETDFRRLDTLKKSKSIADQQYDQVKSAYDLARNNFNFLQENTQLRTPFSGIVSGKYFEDGEIYSGSPIASVGKPAILSIIQINQLKALVNISANYFPLVKEGMKAEVRCDLYEGMNFNGEIYKIYPTIDNSTKTFTVEVKVLNNNLKLRPGMFSKISLNLGKGNAILVPNIAIVKQTGTNDMYIYVNKNNIAIKTLVKTGRMFDDKIEILEGLSDGDEIIVVGQNKLVNQTPIEIKK